MNDTSMNDTSMNDTSMNDISSVADFPVSVRPACESDVERILSLLVQVNNVHNANRPDLFIKNKTKYTEDELSSIINDSSTPVFVAVDENDFVLGYAFCAFQSHKEDNNWPDITTLYIDDICVDEKFRRRHVATSIFNFVKDFARKSGCYDITLNVWDKNDNARAFYEKCGFFVQKTTLELLV